MAGVEDSPIPIPRLAWQTVSRGAFIARKSTCWLCTRKQDCNSLLGFPPAKWTPMGPSSAPEEPLMARDSTRKMSCVQGGWSLPGGWGVEG